MSTLSTYEMNYVEKYYPTLVPPWRKRQELNCLVLRMTVSRTPFVRRTKPSAKDLIWSGTSYNHSSAFFRDEMVDFAPTELVSGCHRGKTVVTQLTGDSQRNNSDQNVRCNLSYLPDVVPETLGANELRNMLGDVKLDLLTNMVEYRKTAQMFSDLSKPLMKGLDEYAEEYKRLLRRYKRIGYGVPGTTLTKKLANLHLAYVFGVKPLIGEMCGAFELLTEGDGKQVFKARRKLRVDRLVAHAGSHKYLGHANNEVAWTLVHNVKAYRKYVVYGELEPITDWRQFSRLGLNPLATAWELVPWSFAIDRFIDIGGALQAMGAFTGIRRAVAYMTYKSERLSTLSCPQGEAVYRVVSTQRSLPSLSWEVPELGFNFGAGQVVTYTALLRQQLGRLSPIFK